MVLVVAWQAWGAVWISCSSWVLSEGWDKVETVVLLVLGWVVPEHWVSPQQAGVGIEQLVGVVAVGVDLVGERWAVWGVAGTS